MLCIFVDYLHTIVNRLIGAFQLRRSIIKLLLALNKFRSHFGSIVEV